MTPAQQSFSNKINDNCQITLFNGPVHHIQRVHEILSYMQQAHESLAQMVKDDILALNYLLARKKGVGFSQGKSLFMFIICSE